MSIPIGALVRWRGSQSPVYGKVVPADPGRVRVQWDDANAPPLFTLQGAPGQLERVELAPGMQVRRTSDDEVGVIVGPAPGESPRWKVAFLLRRGAPKPVLDGDLRPDDALDAVGKLRNRQIGPTKKFKLAVATRWYLLEHLHNDLVCLASARVDVKPHQVGVVHRVVSNYPHRFLLCDEVGLGKTIEAGMVLKELRARGQARRALVIVPPNLLRQWQFELKTKFNETFSIINTDTVRHVQNEGWRGNPFERYESVIVSSSWITGARWSKLVTECDWDLVIVDEAHHARVHSHGNRQTRTQLYELVRDLVDPGHHGSRAVLLLTATPMQLNEYELYSLIEMLDPALFPSPEHFIAHCDRLPGLNRLVDGLRTHGFPIPGEDADDTVERVADWLGVDKEVARERLVEDIDGACDDLSSRHLLSEVLIRNRKAVVKGFMPRVAHRWEVVLTPEEKHAFEAVEDYVLEGYAAERRLHDNAVGFVMVIFQKLMASSIRALARSLKRRRVRLAAGSTAAIRAPELEARLDDDTAAGDLVQAGSALQGEIEELNELLELLESVPVDSKAEALLVKMRILAREDPQVKVLIFTEFRDTQDYLAERLAAEGWGVNTFHGQKPPLDKDRSVDAFRDGTGPQVLVSTEAGGEGRNFQFCHVLVNYDLPWNPMRVEQRIGRVDRIGQDDTVQIYNLSSLGTVEERVLDVLEHRIDAFERTIGGLDPILGETEDDLRRILRRAREERDAAIEALGQDLERKVEAARRAEEQMRDLIMDTKSFSREIAERIAGERSPVSLEDQERFITALLADGRTHIGPWMDRARQLTFNDPLLSDLPDQFVAGRAKLGVFRPDQLRDSEHVEFFAIGHPIVDHLVERVLDENYEGVTGTWQLPAGGGLDPVVGWLIVHEIEVSGLHPYRRMLPVFVTDDGRADVDLGWAIVRRAARLDRHDVEDLRFANVPVDELDEAEEAARVVADEFEEDERQKATRTAREQVERERDRLAAWFEYRERAGADKVATTKATLDRLRASTDEGQRRIIPVWEANLERDKSVVAELRRQRDEQFARLDRSRDPSVSTTIVAAGRIEVVR